MNRSRRRWAAACGAVLALAGPALASGTERVTVRFAGEVGAQWELTPRTPSISVPRGEVFETQVRVRNHSTREMVAMVIKEIRPQEAAGALVHLGCGPTFTLILKPGETAAVPASYFVADDAPLDVAAFDIAYSVYSFEPLSADPLRVGRRIYAERCASCHGSAARGDGTIGRLLAGGVSDLRRALQSNEDRRLLEAIASGAGPMPAFSPALSFDEQQALVLYLRDLVRSEP